MIFLNSIAKGKGFTLIEVLVALAVVAVMAVELSSAGQQVVHQQIRLENKTLAHWVAMNKWVALQTNLQWPALGEHTEEIEMAQQRWTVKTKVDASQQEHFRLVHINVGLSEPDSKQPSQPFAKITTVTGLIGELLTL